MTDIRKAWKEITGKDLPDDSIDVRINLRERQSMIDTSKIPDSDLVAARERMFDAMTSEMLGLRGVPYVWGGSTEEGLDCSGFVFLVASRMAMWPDELERPSAASIAKDLREVAWERRQTCDVICYGDATNGVHHVMMLIGDHVIGAAHGKPPAPGESDEAYTLRMKNAGAQVVQVGDDYWRSKRVKVVRLPFFAEIDDRLARVISDIPVKPTT